MRAGSTGRGRRVDAAVRDGTTAAVRQGKSRLSSRTGGPRAGWMGSESLKQRRKHKSAEHFGGVEEHGDEAHAAAAAAAGEGVDAEGAPHERGPGGVDVAGSARADGARHDAAALTRAGGQDAEVERRVGPWARHERGEAAQEHAWAHRHVGRAVAPRALQPEGEQVGAEELQALERERGRVGPGSVSVGPGKRSVGPGMARKVERAWHAGSCADAHRAVPFLRWFSY